MIAVVVKWPTFQGKKFKFGENVMSVHDFRNDLIEAIYIHMYQHVEDNFDFLRFSYDGVDRSNIVFPIENAKYLEFVLDNIAAFYASSLLFKDFDSRSLYGRLIKYRCIGHPHFRIQENMTWTSSKAIIDKANSYIDQPSKIKFNGMFGPLNHFANLPAARGKFVDIDVWVGNAAYFFESDKHRQYYFQRKAVSIGPERGDWVIDGGSCFGDTAIYFSTSIGNEGKVFTFEPLPVHIEIIRYNIEQNKLKEEIIIIPTGIGETTNLVNNIENHLREVSGPGFSIRGQEMHVPIRSIDEVVQSESIKKIDFIKLDVEGFELSALKGAAATINQFRPKLAISLYHKPEDFFEIPIYLKTQYPFYDLYLDHYTIFSEETVLYAIAAAK
jgi:FkbM family methyltransferase